MLIEYFSAMNPIVSALLATLFTWFMTALGAGLVFFFKTINRKVLDSMLGFAAGVMIAASYWSLLAPAIEMAEESDWPSWIPATSGFLMGGAFLWLIDKLLPHLHPGFPKEEAEGVSTSWRRSILLVLAILGQTTFQAVLIQVLVNAAVLILAFIPGTRAAFGQR